MSNAPIHPEIKVAFVTGATGLLGNNLVRLLRGRGIAVRALCRSKAKAERQLAGLGAEIVEGDMNAIETFAPKLAGVDVLFHTAAFFRDSYKGGSHWEELVRTNVGGTEALLKAAYAAGIRRFVQTSSIATLDGEPGQPINETMRRREADADDYYRSKILADEVVDRFLAAHPDFHATFVLPGWMHGPGDLGPTAAGQFTLDYLGGKLPGLMDASFAFVDARDVAEASLSAAERGRRGERYLAAGRHQSMAELAATMERVTGVPAPKRVLSYGLLHVIATGFELWRAVTRQPVLLSRAGVKLIERERGRTHFDHRKSEAELGLTFRPIEETLRDEIAWFREAGMLPKA